MIAGVVLAAAAVTTGAGSLAARAFSGRARGDRAVAAGLFAVAMPIACVRALSPVHGLAPWPMLLACVAVSILAALAAGAGARRDAKEDGRAAARLFGGALARTTAAPLAWLGLLALGLAAWAAWRFAPWAWDALGYHLPIVQDAIATRTMRVVPTNIPYVNAYPRAVETFFVAARLLLGDDTWIDFAQAPFGVLGAVTAAAFARRAGASGARAAAFGLAFLAVPLVVLQLATDYVDVAVAALLAASVYFATAPRLELPELAAWALATGLFLGSKPSAPPVVAMLGLLVLVRARPRWRAALACATVLVLGGGTYLANVLSHGNPIWPIALDAGPIHLPGEDSAAPLFVQGLPPELARAPWLERLLVSLFVEPRAYIYDMRLGGLGPMAALGLVPLAAVAAARRPRAAVPMLLLACCALASPAAHWMRYSLALSVALLALAAVAVVPRVPRAAVDLALAALAVVGLARAWPGLVAGAGGVDGREAQWDAVRAEVREGEAFAYDGSFSLPGLLTRADGRAGPAVYLGAANTADEVDRAVAEGRGRVVVAGDETVAGEAVRRAGGRYALAFRCPLDPCGVYVRREPPAEPLLAGARGAR